MILLNQSLKIDHSGSTEFNAFQPIVQAGNRLTHFLKEHGGEGVKSTLGSC
jgi:hypothetical protein